MVVMTGAVSSVCAAARSAKGSGESYSENIASAKRSQFTRRKDSAGHRCPCSISPENKATRRGLGPSGRSTPELGSSALKLCHVPTAQRDSEEAAKYSRFLWALDRL